MSANTHVVPVSYRAIAKDNKKVTYEEIQEIVRRRHDMSSLGDSDTF